MRKGWLLLLLPLAGCGPKGGESRVTHVPASAEVISEKDKPWVLHTTDAKAVEPAFLTNGLIGIRLGRSGTGEAADGTSLPFFSCDEYETTGEEKLRVLPNPVAMRWEFNGEVLTPSAGSDYVQDLNMKTGLLNTRWKQSGLTISVVTVMHPEVRQIAQTWGIDTPRSGTLIGYSGISNSKEEAEGVPADLEIKLAPSGMKARIKYGSNQPSDTVKFAPGGMQVTAKLEANTNYTVFRSVTVGDSPNRRTMVATRFAAGGDPKADAKAAKFWPDAAFEPINTGEPRASFLTARLSSEEVWAKRWATDIEIDGPLEDQLAVRSFMFYLQAAANPIAPVAPGPLGLSGTQYNGHVFWDADIWIFPALSLLDPRSAAAIPQYRLATADTARRNFAEWVRAGRPTASGNVGGPPAEGPAVKYAWESSVSGKETVPGPSRFQEHITGSVLWGLDQASALGLVDEKKVDALGREAGAYYLSRSVLGPDGWREIRATMSPDEHFTGNNDLYTNLLAEWTLTRFYPEQDWSFKGYKRPRDAKGLLTYDGDKLKGYKQAAAVLAIYPLQHPEAEREAKTMMERFADKVTANGPAMSESVHATIWARLGDDERAYAAWRKSWEEFAKHPLLLFSEKRRKPVTYFLTGAGGSLQTVLYGFLGFRLDSKVEPKAAWSQKLRGEHWLSVRPNLPPAWKSVKLKNFTVLGKRYTLTATPTSATVSQGE